jgi:uncharacterized protein YgbK (DUF1537 family)
VAIGLNLQNTFGTLNTQNSADAAKLPTATGYQAIVSGSCSVATNAQVADFMIKGGAALAIDPLQIVSGVDVVNSALSWIKERLPRGAVLVYATAEPTAVKAVQARLGVDKAGALVEQALSEIARGLVGLGVKQLIVAGGETSGACVQALGISIMRIGPQIAPGVPWCYSASTTAANEGLHLALKSGNFGAVDFFSSANLKA